MTRPSRSHRIRVRYAEVDGQGVVFNAHWLTYFDETCTRFVESWGFGPDFWINEFDVMLVKAVLEWSGPARFDEWVEVVAEPADRDEVIRRLRFRIGGRSGPRVEGDHLRGGQARHQRLDGDPGRRPHR